MQNKEMELTKESEQTVDFRSTDISHYNNKKQRLELEEIVDEAEGYMVVKVSDDDGSDDDDDGDELSGCDQTVLRNGSKKGEELKDDLKAESDFGFGKKSEFCSQVNICDANKNDKQIDTSALNISDFKQSEIGTLVNNQMEHDTDLAYAQQEELKLSLGSIKKEVIENCDELENLKCQFGGVTPTDYLHYLDHKLCEENNENDINEVKVEKDLIDEDLNYSSIDEIEMENEMDEQSVKIEVDIDDTEVFSLQQPDSTSNNIAVTSCIEQIHPFPMLLIQNSAVVKVPRDDNVELFQKVEDEVKELKILQRQYYDKRCISNASLDENEPVYNRKREREGSPDIAQKKYIKVTSDTKGADESESVIGSKNMISSSSAPEATTNSIEVSVNNDHTYSLPKLLIFTAGVTEKLYNHCNDEELSLRCLYCDRIFSYKLKIRYIEHVQMRHLNILNKSPLMAELLCSEFQLLRNYYGQTKWLNAGIMVKICPQRRCNYIFIDMMLMIKHGLTVHKNHIFIWNKANGNKELKGTSPLKTFEYADVPKKLFKISSPVSATKGKIMETNLSSKNIESKREVIENLCSQNSVRADNPKVDIKAFDKEGHLNNIVYVVKNVTQASKKICNVDTPSNEEVLNIEELGESHDLSINRNKKIMRDFSSNPVNDFDLVEEGKNCMKREVNLFFEHNYFKHGVNVSEMLFEKIPTTNKEVPKEKDDKTEDKIANISNNDANTARYPCRFTRCYLEFMSNDMRVWHEQKHHKASVIPVIYPCIFKHCNLSYTSREEICEHLKKMHSASKSNLNDKDKS